MFSKEFGPRLLKSSAKAAGVGAVIGGSQLIDVTLRHHRESTHQTIETPPWLKKGMDFIEGTLGVDTTEWASVHLLHHDNRDVNLKPFLEIARVIDWCEKNPQHTEGIEIPDSYPHLDMFVSAFSKDDVMEIGAYAQEAIQKRLGDEYHPPDFYTPGYIKKTLYPQTDVFYYDMKKARRDGNYPQDEIETILLRDPHSPALIPPRNGHQNGLRGVHNHNVWPLFKTPGNMFKARPDLKLDYLQAREKTKAEKALLWTAGFVVSAGITYSARRDYTREGLAIAAIAGSVANASRIPAYLEGGNDVNSAGHFYVRSPKEFWKAITSKDAKPVLKPDGTITMDTVDAGIVGRFLSMVTFDEVGGQGTHHDYPENIAFTTKEGREGVIDAPFGKLTEAVVNSRLPFLKPGKQFGGIEKSKRPDMPNPAVLLIERRRAEEHFGSHPDYPDPTA